MIQIDKMKVKYNFSVIFKPPQGENNEFIKV